MKYGLKIKKILFILLGIVMTVLPLSVKADDITIGDEDPKYEISFKFYKVGSEYFNNIYDVEDLSSSWIYDVYRADSEEEITIDTEVHAGDLILMAPVIKLIDGKTADATLFNVYLKYNKDNFNFETFDTQVYFNTGLAKNKGPVPPNPSNGGKTTWKSGTFEVDSTAGLLSLVFKEGGKSGSYIPFENKDEYPFYFQLITVSKDTVLGSKGNFEFVYETGTETLSVAADATGLGVGTKMVMNNPSYEVVDDDITLKTLKVTNTDGNLDYILNPAFTSGATPGTYKVNVPGSVDKVKLVAEPKSDSGAILPTLIGEKSVSVGTNSFDIIVTNPNNGETGVYTIEVKRLSNEAKLSGLTLSGITDGWTFNENTKTYNITVPYATSSTTVTGTPKSPATIESGNGAWNLSVGTSNTRNIVVASEECDSAYASDMTNAGATCTKETYTINITRSAASTDAKLSALSVDGYNFTSGFNPDTFSYTLENIPNNVTSLTVNATKNDSKASNPVITGNTSIPVGDSNITVKVVAEDGTTEKTYTIAVHRLDNNTKLSTLNITSSPQGTLSPATFNPDTTTYTYTYDETVTSINVAATAQSNVTIVDGVKSYNPKTESSAVINTEAEDGTKGSYTINFVKQTSSNAYLKNLTVTDSLDSTTEYNLNKTFNKNDFSYTVEIPTNVTSVVVSADAESDSATVTGTGTITISDFNPKVVTIEVTPESGASGKKTYTVTINRKKSSNANLKNIKLDGTEISGFSASTTTYDLGTFSKVDSLNITAEAEDSNATVVVSGNTNLVKGQSNTITITVTPQDGSTPKEYTLTAYVKDNNTKLVTLNVTSSPQGVLNPTTFNPDTTSYTYTYDETVTSIDVAATADSKVTIVDGIGTFDPSTTTSTTINTEAEDGTKGSYTINFVRKKSSNSYLMGLTASVGTFDKAFNKDEENYKLTIPNDATSVTLTATKESASAEVTDNGVITVNVPDFNPVTQKIVVTPEIDRALRTYTVVIEREKSNNANLKNIKLDGSDIADFDKDTLSYDLGQFASTTTSLNLTAEAENQYANVKITGNNLVKGQNNTITITVTPQDGSTPKVYTLTAYVKSDNTNLATLSVTSTPQGELTPNTVTGTTTYTYHYDTGVTSVEVNATAVSGNAVTGTGIHNLVDGKSITLTTIAEDSGIVQTYTINLVERNSKLSNLRVLNGGTEVSLDTAFNPDTLSYTATVDPTVSNVDIEATQSGDVIKSITTNSGTFTSVDKVHTASINLTPGLNNITIVVTAEDDSATTYTLEITKEVNSDATLTDITLDTDLTDGVDGTTIDGFASGTFQYNIDVPYKVKNIELGATGVLGTTVTGTGVKNNLNVGDNTFDIVVSPQSGSDQTYRVIIHRQSNQSTLTGLTVTSNPASTLTDNGNNTYTLDVPFEVSNVSVNVSGLPVGASIKYGNNDSLQNIDITNLSQIVFDVYAEDKSEEYKTTYTINLNKLAAVNPITNLNVLGVDATFNSVTNQYEVTVDSESVSVKQSDVIVTGAILKSADSETTLVNSSVGTTTYNITVTNDYGTDFSYPIVITRPASSVNTLKTITSDKGTFDKSLNEIDTTYKLTLPIGTTEFTLGGTKTSNYGTVTGFDTYTIPVTDNKVSVIVTSEDGTARTYEIEVEVLQKPVASLSALEVVDHPFTETFSPSNLTYDIGNIATDVTSLTINATMDLGDSIKYQVNNEVADTNNVVTIPSDLGAGTIKVIVSVTDGDDTVYTINYNKGDSGLDKITPKPDTYTVDSDYIIDKSFHTFLDASVDYSISLDAYLNNFENERSELKVYEKDGTTEITDLTRFEGTGLVIKLERNGTVLDQKSIVKVGDTNGDGRLSINDAVQIAEAINNAIDDVVVMDPPVLVAAEINNLPDITINDAVLIADKISKIID